MLKLGSHAQTVRVSSASVAALLAAADSAGLLSGVVELVMRVLAALVLPALMGEWGIYLAEILAWAGAAVLLMGGYYRRMRLLSLQASR